MTIKKLYKFSNYSQLTNYLAYWSKIVHKSTIIN